MTARVIRASAEILAGTRNDQPKRAGGQTWQEEAWAFYNESGPLRYGATWTGNLISRTVLRAARLTPNGEAEPIDDGPAADAVAELFGGQSGQSAALKTIGVQLTVPGISFLVGTPTGDGRPTDWQVLSADTLKIKTTRTANTPAIYEKRTGNGDRDWVELPSGTLAVQIWQPHPDIWWEADSPARAALPPLREFRRIGQYIDAVLASRVACAGLFIFPTQASFPTSQGKENPEGLHPFVTEVMQVMTTAIKNPGTASAVVPIPIEADENLTDKFQFIDIASSLNEHVLDMRESAMRQIAVALDVPGEIITGMADANHWTGWAITEDAVKVHAEPLVTVVTGALTTGYLHPTLLAMEQAPEDIADIIIWGDTSNLSTRPDRSTNAIALYDRLELSGEAARRETGLAETDKPDDTEYKQQVLQLLLKNTTLAQQAAAELGVLEPAAPVTSPPATGDTGTDNRLNPAVPVDQNTPPDQPSANAQLLVLEAHVFRALEKAGNRIRSSSRGHQSMENCPPEQAHCCLDKPPPPDMVLSLLNGAWTKIPSVATELGLDPVSTIRCLDSYCKTLLEGGFAYDRDAFALALTSCQSVKVDAGH